MIYNIFSWNVNGIRAVHKKGELAKFIEKYQPDIICFQETKAKQEQSTVDLPEYTEYWHSAARAGYSGTAIFSKSTPLVTYNNFEKFDPDFTTQNQALITKLHDQYGDPLSEGRILTAEYPEFFLVTVYTPNSKGDLSRLSLRHELWDPLFLAYLKQLETIKPVVVCGDFNAAHTEIDLARPKDNTKNAGFTIEEREGITNIINQDFTDTFRHFNPNIQRYTWWSHWGHARENNVGWRIDYFFTSKALTQNLKSAEIYESQLGSDHCPINITLEF